MNKTKKAEKEVKKRIRKKNQLNNQPKFQEENVTSLKK